MPNGGLPDFEPAVIAMDSSGMLLWWSRLYHEITPAGDTVNSSPDQYVDALAIDYANDKLVVGARCHGNNTENFWEGNTIAADTSASGFQNNFTGSNGNIHISWLGKFSLNNGTLSNSTYMAELAEGTGGLGTPHPDPNLDGWPNPNGGWPNVNTTKMAKNNMKVSSNGDVCVIASGRRTITTANAYQKMVKPNNGGLSCWNSFVRVYDSQFHVPKYSSLIVGAWDTLTQAGGDNTEIFGVYKTGRGVICVGRQKADTSGIPVGNNIPVVNVCPWGNATPQNESAILVYYQATNLYNPNDSIASTGTDNTNDYLSSLEPIIYPNPASDKLNISLRSEQDKSMFWKYKITDISGRIIVKGELIHKTIGLDAPDGIYILQIFNANKNYFMKIVMSR